MSAHVADIISRSTTMSRCTHICVCSVFSISPLAPCQSPAAFLPLLLLERRFSSVSLSLSIPPSPCFPALFMLSLQLTHQHPRWQALWVTFRQSSAGLRLDRRLSSFLRRRKEDRLCSAPVPVPVARLGMRCDPIHALIFTLILTTMPFSDDETRPHGM